VAKLVVRAGRNTGAEYRLNADRLVMGRRSAAPIPVLDPKASREHAVITRKGDQFFVQDISRNGALVNNQPASKNGEGPTPLRFGDKIQIGDTIMEMVDESKEPIPIEIPGYKIMEKVGSGGMGTVYKARQLSMDRVVALKVLNEKYSANKEFVDRFIREARAAGKLNHPNVIHVHDTSKANNRHYFSMEYVDGFPVKELLRIHGKLDAKRSVDIALQTAKALEFAHENGIVHRDVKPDNIMLSKDGVVKIADLGIAKSFEEAGLAEGLTKDPRRVMGTPHYMAPEQALGKEIDHRVDVYALGATLYHLLTGHTPFSGSTAHEVIKAHIQESLPPIQEFSPDVPDALCFVVERMMAKLPEKRYPNMTRLVEDLERFQKGAAVEIERVPEGDSTIQPAVKGELPKARKKERTDEIGTGVYSPIRKALTYIVLVAVFVAVVLAVVVFLKPPPQKEPDKDGAGTPATGGGEEQGAQAQAEALKKLEEAKKLLDVDPLSVQAETDLKDLTARFPTLDEPKKLLKDLTEKRKEAGRKKVADALEKAAQFEQANEGDAAKYGEIAKQFQAVAPLAAGFDEIANRAKERAAYWDRRVKEHQNQQARAAWDKAAAEADKAARAKDYDTARKAVQDFLAAHGATSVKADADAKAKALDDEANGIFQRAQEEAERAAKDAAHAVPLGLTAWDGYLASVTDSAHKAQAEAAKKDLTDKAEKLCQDEDAKVSDLVKQFDFATAAANLRKLRERLAGTKWADSRKARMEDLIQLRDLHKRLVTEIGERAREGPLPLRLPFKLKIGKFDVDEWGVAGPCDNEQTLKLDAMAKGKAPGCQKKFSEFTPEEQYKIYRAFLPEPRTAEDQKALAVFCKERGLAEPAQ
jgi:serine/threonine-protein kinase